MGAAGSDVAVETADTALMHDDLSKVAYLIDLSTKTMSVVRENVTAAILIKASFAVPAFPGNSLTALSASRDLLLSSAHDDGITCALRHRSRRANVIKRDAGRPRSQCLERKHLSPSCTRGRGAGSGTREGLALQSKSACVECWLPVIPSRLICEQRYRELFALSHDYLLS